MFPRLLLLQSKSLRPLLTGEFVGRSSETQGEMRKQWILSGAANGPIPPQNQPQKRKNRPEVRSAENFQNGRPCSDEQLRLSFRSKNTQIIGNKRSLIPVTNSRPNGGFCTIDSPFAKIPPQIERTCAVRPSQIPFNGEFSTPESEFVTENGGCTAQNGHGLYDCPKTEKRQRPLTF